LMLFNDAVTVTFCATLTVPAVAVKGALLWLAETVTLAGTVNNPLLLPKETVVALVAALFKNTVQLLDALLASDVGEQDTEESCAGALAVSVKV
jgi:hypothetical protein